MRQLSKNQIQMIAGGVILPADGNDGSLIDASFAIMGGYLGSSIAYIESLTTRQVLGDALTGYYVSATPNPLVMVGGIMLGASIGYAISHGIQMSKLFSEE